MEFFTIFLSSLFGLISPTGLVVESAAQKVVRSQFAHVEKLQVRIDNAPTHQLLNGRVERIRIAGRGLQLKQLEMRVAVLELESDPMNLNLRNLRAPKLEQPLQALVRLVLNQQDINQALRSPKFTAALRNLSINILQPQSSLALPSYNLINPHLELLANNRLRFQVELTEADTKPLVIRVETRLNLIARRQLQLLEPVIYVNEEKVPEQILLVIANNLSKQLDLTNLEVYGVQSRILKLEISPDKIELAAFLRVDPSSPFMANRKTQIIYNSSLHHAKAERQVKR